MPLSKSVGNMYTWVTHKKTYTRGWCEHKCKYCYVPHSRAARFYSGEPRLIEKEFEENLGSGKIIFIGHMTDMFGEWMPDEWIKRILKHCQLYDNTYVFQNKDTKRLYNFRFAFPSKTILGTTIETNRSTHSLSNAPTTSERQYWIGALRGYSFDLFVSIEPIMDFDLDILLDWIHAINPKFVSIGADSWDHNLPEPSAEKVQRLITGLGAIEVRLKSNLRRLGVW